MAAARASGCRRVIAQSLAFVYATSPEPHLETDALASAEGEGRDAINARGVRVLEEAVLNAPGIEGIVLRHGLLYGPGTWFAACRRGGARGVPCALARIAGHLQHRRRLRRGLDREGSQRAWLRSDVQARSCAQLIPSPSAGRRKRLAEKARALKAVAPGFVDRLGQADARAGYHLNRLSPGQDRKGRLIERQAIVQCGNP